MQVKSEQVNSTNQRDALKYERYIMRAYRCKNYENFAHHSIMLNVIQKETDPSYMPYHNYERMLEIVKDVLVKATSEFLSYGRKNKNRDTLDDIRYGFEHASCSEELIPLIEQALLLTGE